MVFSCKQIGYPDYLEIQSKSIGGLVDSFDLQIIDVRGIALTFDIFSRPPFAHVKIAQRIILRDSMNEDQMLSSLGRLISNGLTSI